MLLSNKHVKVVMLTIFAMSVLATPIHTCDDKKKQVIEKKEVVSIKDTDIPLYVGVPLAFNEVLESSGRINVAEEKKEIYTEERKEVSVTSSISAEVPEITQEPVKLASNGNPYVYYEVYDFFYGSEKYHILDYELQEYTYELCIENNIEEYFTLILCQLYYESQYKTDIISETNDYGIAQINKCNHNWLSKKLGITDFLDAKQSISCNIHMMSSYLKKYSVESSLFCYNTGKPNGSNAYSRNIIYMWNNGIKKIEE